VTEFNTTVLFNKFAKGEISGSHSDKYEDGSQMTVIFKFAEFDL
jgi:hypothetical protein